MIEIFAGNADAVTTGKRQIIVIPALLDTQAPIWHDLEEYLWVGVRRQRPRDVSVAPNRIGWNLPLDPCQPS
ncbi:hypothetical protein NKH14_13320 [Mesorhizobium sp. M1380]|uniref:hypothetical protein n=1 Tax=Mesorhizobium sp. M1380 TaxID=2957093 RepID=UPI00333D44E5